MKKLHLKSEGGNYLHNRKALVSLYDPQAGKTNTEESVKSPQAGKTDTEQSNKQTKQEIRRLARTLAHTHLVTRKRARQYHLVSLCTAGVIIDIVQSGI